MYLTDRGDFVIFCDEKQRNTDDIMTIEELMDYLAIGKNTAYELVQKGYIKSFRIGRKYKIPKEAVLEYVDNQRKMK